MTQNFGILAIPPDASELTQHLVPRLMRTALEGAYDIHCENCERRQRALACFLVMCNFLAAVTDSDDIVDRLSEEAKAYIEQSREGLREIEAMAAARGMTPDQLLKTAASDLELRSEQIPAAVSGGRLYHGRWMSRLGIPPVPAWTVEWFFDLKDQCSGRRK